MIPLIHLAARRAARAAVVAALCAAGLAISGSAAAEPGAFEVVGYQGADYSGASKTWTLPAERPYRYVPFVGDDIGGNVASVVAGGGVGAVLFERPFFTSKDSICAPDIGSDARPDLKWLGATATFAAPFGPEAGRAAANPAAGPKGFASLIIFRKDLGPPPGALLMDRRRTIGTSCRSPVHKTSYKRLFVPVTEPPERSRCFNLSGAYRFEDSKEKVLNFTTADRLALLAPGDYSDLYGGVRHYVTATAFDTPDCAGDSLSFKSGSSATDVFRLADFRFRDRARSIRISYDGGPLTPYLSAPPTPVETPVAKLTPAPATQTPAVESAATPAPEAPAKKAVAPVQAEIRAQAVRAGQVGAQAIRGHADQRHALSDGCPAGHPQADARGLAGAGPGSEKHARGRNLSVPRARHLSVELLPALGRGLRRAGRGGLVQDPGFRARQHLADRQEHRRSFSHHRHGRQEGLRPVPLRWLSGDYLHQVGAAARSDAVVSNAFI
jgi:hypothetical protein